MLAAALTAGPAHASVTEFRLPPASSPQAQPPPDRQGPVAPDVPASRRPAPTATPTPAPTAAAPAPAITPPALVVPQVRPTGARPTPVRTTAQAAGASPAPAAPAEAGTTGGALTPGLGFPAETAAPSAPAAPPAAVAEPAEEGGFPWLWALGGVAALGAIGFAGWSWRRRQAPAVREAPRVERPRVGPAPVPAPGPATPAAPPPPPRPARQPVAAVPEPLQIALEPLRLSLTLMNATLAYRLQVTNGGMAALTGLAIGADMISAHASLSREEQLAGPIDASAGQWIDRLEPGESRVVEGEFRLPFQQIVPIRQGRAALLLPLARFRVEAEGAAPVVRTFLVGQPGASERLQPFRLDLGPRIYPNLAQHAFA